MKPDSAKPQPASKVQLDRAVDSAAKHATDESLGRVPSSSASANRNPSKSDFLARDSRRVIADEAIARHAAAMARLVNPQD